MQSLRFWPPNSRIRLASIRTCVTATLPHVFYLLDLHGTQPRVRHPHSRGDSSDCDWMRLRFPTGRRFRSDPQRGRVHYAARSCNSATQHTARLPLARPIRTPSPRPATVQSTQRPQGVPAWRLRGTLSVIGKTRSRCDQSALEIATSPSGLDAPDHRNFPKIRIDAVRRRDVPFGLTSEVDSPTRPQVPIRRRPHGSGSPAWVSSVGAGTGRKVE